MTFKDQSHIVPKDQSLVPGPGPVRPVLVQDRDRSRLWQTAIAHLTGERAREPERDLSPDEWYIGTHLLHLVIYTCQMSCLVTSPAARVFVPVTCFPRSLLPHTLNRAIRREVA